MQDKQMKELEQQVRFLRQRVEYLQSLLDKANIPYESSMEYANEKDSIPQIINQGELIIPEAITKNHAKFFYSMFKGRIDVYSKRAGKPNAKTGKTGYYTQCWNFWKDGVCPKKKGAQIKCGNCENQKYKQLTGKDLMNHLMGIKEDCSDVIGIYPMFPNETCNFLVFDFDNHDDKSLLDDYANTDKEWIEEVNAMRVICIQNGVDVLVERSRSGKGAHVWMFFEEAIPVALARRFGDALLTKGSESVNQKSFKAYDRMLPAQDKMPEGGVGNLIALPLQGRALKEGNSAFIDEEWNAYPNQWKTLQGVKKLSKAFIEECIKAWGEDGALGLLAEDLSGNHRENTDESVDQSGSGIKEGRRNNQKKDKEKPWEKRKRKFEVTDVEGILDITLANQIFINVNNVKPRMQNQIRRLAAYSNPEFYKNQAMGFSMRGTPRIISCSTETDDYIGIPRGCEEKFVGILNESGVKYNIQDCRQNGKAINVCFKGELYPEQQEAAQRMLAYDNGVLHAATAFGKTAVGAYLVATRKVNTLVLVHNTEIMKNWVEDFEKFLEINEESPEYITPKGRIKRRKSVIGRLNSSHNSVTGILDVVMISSLGKKGEINELVKEYGMVIMDECHHGASQTAEDVLQEVNARYVYGLTATPKRDDGQEQKIFMQFGPVRYRYTAKDRAKKQGIGHFVYPRFTRLTHTNGTNIKVNDANRLVIESKLRNQQIISDVVDCLEQGRTPLVLTKNREHAAYLYEQLKGKTNHIFLLQGGRNSKERDEIRNQMRAVPENESIVLVATGQYIGEGFNYPRLDTMMLTMPISWQGNVEQYSGRLHRDYESKKDVIIYDYVDAHIKVLEKMYHKRLRTYKKMGYEICLNLNTEKQEANSIFDSKTYKAIYEKDLLNAAKEIVISSPGLNVPKVKQLIRQMRRVQENGVGITVLTLEPESYPEARVDVTKQLVEEMVSVGMQVKLMSQMHEHYAIVDREIVWYGSMNLLSSEKEEDNLMRVVSEEIVEELMEMDFGASRTSMKEESRGVTV